jgi:hypothetical protein
MSILEPRYPAHPGGVLNEMCVGALTRFVWLLTLHPTHPIVADRAFFWIRLPHVPHLLEARVGPLFRADEEYMVMHLITNHPECPRYVAILIAEGIRYPTDITWLSPITHITMDLNMTFMYLG